MSVPTRNPALLPLKTIKVSHLNGTSISYSLPIGPIKNSKPTLVFINGYSGSAHRFRAQVDDPQLSEVANLLVLEPLGHGGTNTNAPAFTLWDAAWAFVQVLDALNVQKFVVCGTSMGGWIASRMALYTPERVGHPAINSTGMETLGAKALIESRYWAW
jgi:pimeloyl-ACP methyl ester carboxylesterase